MQKKLYRSPEDGIVLGIASGIGHYFDKDPVLIRLIFVVLFFVTGYWPMIVAYAVLFFIIPVDPAQAKVESNQEPKDVTSSAPAEEASDEKKADEQPEPSSGPQDGGYDSEPDGGPRKQESMERTESTEPLERMDSSQNM